MLSRLFLNTRQTFFKSNRISKKSHSMMAMTIKKYPHIISEQEREIILAASNASQTYLLNLLDYNNQTPDPATSHIDEVILKKYSKKVDADELEQSLKHQSNQKKFSIY